MVLYGDVFGAHSVEALHGALSLEQRHEDALARATALGDMWMDSMPVTWLAVLFIGLLLAARSRSGRIARSTAAIVAFTWLGTAAIAPNTGGLQIGPRYLLVAVAPLVLCLALGLTQLRLVRPLSRALVIALVLGVSTLAVHENVTDRASLLEENYRGRIYPALAAVQGRPGEAVVFSHPWAPMEMASSLAGRSAVTVNNRRELDRAVVTILQHEDSVLLIDGPGRRRYPVIGAHRHGDRQVSWSVLSEGAEYAVVRGQPVNR